jgi:hypothetical protein
MVSRRVQSRWTKSYSADSLSNENKRNEQTLDLASDNASFKLSLSPIIGRHEAIRH